jgi:predicted RNA-binding Zn-ribbon protein involved in translation (DUF1610 family)
MLNNRVSYVSIKKMNLQQYKFCPKCGVHKLPISRTLVTPMEYGDTYVNQYDGMEYLCPTCGEILDRIYWDEERERL